MANTNTGKTGKTESAYGFLRELNAKTARKPAPAEVAATAPAAIEVPAGPPTGPALADIFTRTEESARNAEQPADQFLGSGAVGLYSKMLVGVPFLFETMPEFSHKEGKFGLQELATAYIRLVNYQERQVLEPILATFQGAYLLNGIRNATRNELVHSRIFTVAPNPEMGELPSGGYPLMIKVYDPQNDGMSEEEMPF